MNIRMTPSEVRYRFINDRNMNAQQRRTLRRLEKKHLPKIVARMYQRIDDDIASARVAAAREESK